MTPSALISMSPRSNPTLLFHCGKERTPEIGSHPAYIPRTCNRRRDRRRIVAYRHTRLALEETENLTYYLKIKHRTSKLTPKCLDRLAAGVGSLTRASSFVQELAQT